FGGAACVTVAALTTRSRLQYVGYVLIGMATLTKGPLAGVLCALPFALAIAVSPDARRRLLALHWMSGIGIVIAIASPWYLLMIARHNGDFVSGYFFNENVFLFALPLYGNQPSWLFYLGIVPLAVLPWSGLVLGRLYDDVRIRNIDTFELLLWLWVGSIVGFF